MASIDDLYELAAAFLQAAETALEQTPSGPPARAFVSPGEPALDCCDQLTVHTTLINEADLNTRSTSGALGAAKSINRGGVIRVTLEIMVTRCVPTPEEKNGRIRLPDPAELDAAARTIDEDGWALWVGMSQALKHGSLHELCSGAERLGAVKLAQQGGCGGWVFTYRYPIEGGMIGT